MSGSQFPGEILALIFLVVMASFIVWSFWDNLGVPVWNWIRRRRAAGWPLASAIVQTGYVEPYARAYSAILDYSYVADGKHYSGWWRRGPIDEGSAEMLVIRTRGRDLAIRYKNEKPAVSVVRFEDNPKWVPWSL